MQNYRSIEDIISSGSKNIGIGNNYPEISVAANGVRPLTDEAEAFLENLYKICNDFNNHTSIKIGRGQAMFVNNRKGLHARTAFTPTFGPDERWLLRANLRLDT